MKPVVLFGSGKIAEVLLYFFRHHSPFEVVAVTADRPYLAGDRWHDLPVIAFDEVEQQYPPDQHDMFVAVGYQDLNGLRAGKCAEARSKGYLLVSYVHPQAGLPADCEYG